MADPKKKIEEEDDFDMEAWLAKQRGEAPIEQDDEEEEAQPIKPAINTPKLSPQQEHFNYLQSARDTMPEDYDPSGVDAFLPNSDKIDKYDKFLMEEPLKELYKIQNMTPAEILSPYFKGEGNSEKNIKEREKELKEHIKLFVDKYDKNGVDIGINVIKTGKGKDDYFLKFKSQASIGPATGKEYVTPELEKINEQLDIEAKKNVFGTTTAAEQFMTGLLAPMAEVTAGAMTMVTGDKKWMDQLSDPTTEFGSNYGKEWDTLSPAQKSTYIGSYVIGMTGPGGVFKGVTKAGLGIAVSAAGKEALVQSTYKGLNRYIGKTLIPKLPTDILKKTVGAYSGKFIKSAPALATEGFLWETIATGGDAKAGLYGAVLFPLTGPAIEMGMGSISRQVSKGYKALTTPESAKPTASPSVPPLEMKSSVPEEVIPFNNQPKIEPKFNSEQKATLAKVTKSADLVNKVLMSSEPIKGFDNKAFQTSKVLLGVMKSSLDEANKLSEAALLNKKNQALEKVFSRNDSVVTSIKNKIKEKYSKFLERSGAGVKEGESFFYMQQKPATIDQLKTNYHVKDFLYDRFGKDLNRIVQVAGSGDRRIIAQTLVKSGLGTKSALSVARQITEDKLLLRKTTDIKKLFKVDSDKRIILSEVKNLRKQLDSLLGKQEKIENKILLNSSKPNYNEAIDPNYFKINSKEQYAMNKFHAQTQEMGYDFTKVKIGSVMRVMNQTEKWSRVEEATGWPIGRVVYDLIGGTSKKGHLENFLAKNFKWGDAMEELRNLKPKEESLEQYGHKLWKYFHYVEKNPQTGEIRWNPNPEASPWKTVKNPKMFSVPAFEGPPPSETELKFLFNLRDASHSLWEMASASGSNINYINNYVGIKSAGKKGILSTRFNPFGKTKLTETGITKERHWGIVPESQISKYDTNLFSLFPRMVRDGVREAALGQAEQNAKVVDWMMRASGRPALADDFMSYVRRAMGLPKADAVAESRALQDVRENGQWLNVFGKVGESLKEKLYKTDIITEETPTLLGDLHKAAVETMYHSYIGLSGETLIKQFIQPELVAAAEVGLKNVEWARSMMAGKKLPLIKGKFGSYEEALKRVEQELIPPEMDPSTLGRPQIQWIKTLTNILKTPGKPGMKAFGILEGYNRKLTFVSALKHFDDALGKNKLPTAFKDLLESERSALSDAFEAGGIQKARDLYGLIRSKRANFAYNLSDKPDWFSEGIGKQIPFVSWGTNQWMRHVENLRKFKDKTYSPLIKRLAYSYGGVMAAQYLFNEKFYSEKIPMPTGGNVEVNSGLAQSGLSIAINPQLGPLTAYSGMMTGDAIPWIRGAKKIKKRYEKSTGEKYENFNKAIESTKKLTSNFAKPWKIMQNKEKADWQEVIKYSPNMKGVKKNEKETKYLFPGFKVVTKKKKSYQIKY